MLKLPLERLHDLLLNQVNITKWNSIDLKKDSIFCVIGNQNVCVGTIIYLVDLISIRVVGIHYTNNFGLKSVTCFYDYIKVVYSIKDSDCLEMINFQPYDLLTGKSLYKKEESDYKNYITSLIFEYYNLSTLKSMLNTTGKAIVVINLKLRISEVTNNLKELLNNYKRVYFD